MQINGYLVPNHRILSKVEERELFRQYVKTPTNRIKNHISQFYLKFAIQCGGAYKRKYFHVHHGDLIGYAMLGLLDAIDKYDPETNAKFTTYAVWWIKAAIHRNVELYESLVRQPATVHTKLQKAINDNDYSSEIGTLFEAVQGGVSLDSTACDDGTPISFKDYIVDPAALESISDVEREETNALLLYHIDTKLNARERRIVKDYFGFFGERTQSKDLAIQLGVSRELVRHVRNKAIGKLKNGLVSQKNSLSY